MIITPNQGLSRNRKSTLALHVNFETLLSNHNINLKFQVIAMVTPAVYATMWRLSTTEESNDQGTWGNYTVAKVDLVSNRDILMEAKAFRESIMAGEVKAAADPEHTSTGNQGSEEDIPF